MALTLIVTVLVSLITIVNSVDNNNLNIEMNLDYSYSYNNRFLLNITDFNKQISTHFIDFREDLIYCLQSNDEDMINAVRIKHRLEKIDQTSGPFVKFHIFNLLLETEGFIQCFIDNNITEIKSNIQFFRFNNNVFVVKLNISENITNNEIAKKFEKIVDRKNFIASVKINNSVHLTATMEKTSPNIDNQILNDLITILENKLARNSSEFMVRAVRSTRYCPRFETDNLIIPQSMPGTLYATKIINQENNYPFTVKCIGDFYSGYYWDENDIDVILQAIASTILPTASAIMSENTFNLDTPSAIQEFANKLSTVHNFTANEIPELTSKMDQLLGKGNEVFDGLRENLNTSNEILASLDNVLVNTRGLNDKGFEESVRPNFAARVEDIRVTLGAGVAVIDNQEELTVLSDKTFVKITQNMDTENILDLAPRTALLLPAKLLNATDTPHQLALSVFSTGAIFSSRPTSNVVSANLGGQHFTNLLEPVRIWFRRDISVNPEAGVCVSWDFSKNKGRGDWSKLGCRLITTHTNISYSNNNSVLDECACWHLTHFGELFWYSEEPLMESIHPSHSKTLDLITLTGCFLSLAGLAGVFITAIFAPEWLRGSGQKIQLQISLNFACVIILYLILSNIDLNGFLCVFLGVLLHYSMLSNFCWMLLAAYLQYTRLVKVVSSRSSRLPLKSGLIGWILPMIPCFSIIVSGQYEVYSQPPLCLPRGIAFFTSILTPLVIVMCCNIVVFILIAKNLYVNIKIRRHDNNCISFRRFKQLIFLFFLLGLAWIFAIAQLVCPKPWNVIFSYLFCICIASKGLTYFIFFIVMDESAKNAWRLRLCPSRARYDVKRYAIHSRITASTSGGSNGATDRGVLGTNGPSR